MHVLVKINTIYTPQFYTRRLSKLGVGTCVKLSLTRRQLMFSYLNRQADYNVLVVSSVPSKQLPH